MDRQIFGTLLTCLLPLAGCVEEQPIPQDIYEDGWDRVSPQTRVDVLRADLEATLAELDYVVGAKRERLIRSGARQLSALRPELMTVEGGRDEYHALEQRLEALSGDAR